MILLIILILLLYINNVNSDNTIYKYNYGYDLPVIPKTFIEYKDYFTDINPNANNKEWSDKKHIPQNIYIAVRNINDSRPNHLGPFAQKNSNWSIHFCDNANKNHFMQTVFANTSTLWAYEVLNPQIGTSKVEIWRLAILYAWGGMYMDDDANFGTNLDDVIQIDDKLILGKEGYDYDDRCYVDEYILSNHSLIQKYGLEQQLQQIFDNKFFFNWAIFSAPRHPIILRVLEHIAVLIKAEYLGKSLIKMNNNDHRGKLLMCATTYPITLAAREFVLQNATEGLGLRIGGVMFGEYGAEMKAWYNDYLADHWVKAIQKHRYPYLQEYGPIDPNVYNNKIIQAPGAREIFLVINGTKHCFPDLATFMAMGFDLENVIGIPHNVMDQVPIGPQLPHMEVGLG